MSFIATWRYAVRGLRKSPGYAAAIIVTLAMGIGANATMFGLVDRLMLSPPPQIGSPDRVFHLAITFTGSAGEQFTATTTSYPAYTDMRDQSPALSGLAAASGGEMIYGTGADARTVASAKVTGNFFAVLGSRPFLGRFFADADDAAPSGTPVVVLSHAFWQREFAGDRGIIGRVIRLSDGQFTIIGVAPPDFNGDEVQPIDVWVPLHAAMPGQIGWQTERHLNLIILVGRLRDGASAGLAAGQATLAFRRGATGGGNDDLSARVGLRPLVPGKGSEPLSTQSQVALWLAGMSAIVFVVAIANVTNLVLVRTVRRRREIAVRLALGAGRWRIVRQLTVESLLLAGLGGACALLIAGWASEAVRALLLPGMSATSQLVPRRIVAITLVATALAVLVTGLVPAIRATRPSLVADLKEGSGAIGHHRSPALMTLLAVQSALSVLLLTGAGLFLVSLNRVRRQDLGFSPEHVLLASMQFTGSVPGPTRDAIYRDAEERVRHLPGVLQTSLVQATPFEGGFNVPPISVPGREDFPHPDQQLPALSVATPTYFRILGMRLIAGRGFTTSDGPASHLVVVINDAMARALWPGQSAIGKCIRIGFGGLPPSGPAAPPTEACREVVGVVNTARRRSIREETSQQARMQYYVPFGQLPKPGGGGSDQGEVWGMLVRTNGTDAMPVLVRRTMQSFRPNLPFTQVRTLQALLDRQIQPWTLGAAMFSVFGALVLALSALGLYSVRAYSVAQRNREMGVRIALGAQAGHIVRMIGIEGLRIMGAGLLLGMLATLLGGKFIEPLLFGVSAHDPLVLLGVIAVFLAIGALANAVPALRAARVDPARAMRAE